MKRTSHVALLLCTLILCTASLQVLRAQTSPAKKNILYIVIDDMNDYPYAAGNGNNTPATPNMDSLSDHGFTFDNCFTNAPICGPSRTSFLTGKTPVYTDVLYNPQNLVFRDNFDPGQQIITLMEHLRNNGYYSVGIQKLFHNFWRDGFDNDTLLSFDEYTVHDDDPFVAIFKENIQDEGYQWGMVEDSDEAKLMDYKSVTLALDYMANHAADVAADTNTAPLLLMVGIDKPHLPNLVPEKYYPDQYIRDYTTATEVNYWTPSNPDGWIMPEYSSGGADSIYGNLTPAGKLMVRSLNEVQWGIESWAADNASSTIFNKNQLEKVKMANMDMAYYAACKYADAQVGRLIRGLQVNDMLQNTIVIIHSDHGFTTGQRREWTKQTLWDDVLRIPLIIFDPDKAGGKRIAEPVSLVDMFPTVLDMVGVAPPAGNYLDGQSLVPLLNDQLMTRPVHSRIIDPYTSGLDCNAQQSMISGPWHLIQYEGCAGQIEKELYNLETDPYEWHNVADTPAYALMQEYLENLLPDDSTWTPSSELLMRLNAPSDTIFADELVDLTAEILDSTGAVIPKPSGSGFIINDDLTENTSIGSTYTLDLPALPAGTITEPQKITIMGFLVRIADTSTRAVASRTLTVMPSAVLKSIHLENLGPMRIFPNPATDHMNLQIESLKDAGAIVSIYSMDGHQWNERAIEMKSGSNQFSFDLSQMPSGMYQLVVKMSDGTQTQGGLFAVVGK